MLTEEKKAALERYEVAWADFDAATKRINSKMRAGHVPNEEELELEQQLRLELLKARHALLALG